MDTINECFFFVEGSHLYVVDRWIQINIYFRSLGLCYEKWLANATFSSELK